MFFVANRGLTHVLISVLAACAWVPTAHAQAADTAAAAQPRTCAPAPDFPRPLYLRGGMNSWGAEEKFKFLWACDRYELVASVQGEHRFKVADESWSKDADWGAETPEGSHQLAFGGAAKALLPIGAPLSGQFQGATRFVLRFEAGKPSLSAERCPIANPSAMPTFHLRGTPNNWAASEEFAFRFSCDAHYLNVKLSGAHSFKLADSAWSPATTFGAAAAAGAGRVSANTAHPLAKGTDAGGQQDLSFTFSGEHTLRLDASTTPTTLRIGPKTFADASAPTVTDPAALSVRFDSRNPQQRSPFGAVPAGSTVQLALGAGEGVKAAFVVLESRKLEGNQEVLEYTRIARTPMQIQEEKQAAPGGQRFTAQLTLPNIGVFGYWFEVHTEAGKFAYQNNSDAVFWTREKGSGGSGEVAPLPQDLSPTSAVRRYRISVYDPKLAVPAWAQDAVYYYVFPERFKNGNRANDPQPGKTKYHQHTVELHKSWLEAPFKPGTGDGSDAHFNNDFFGGDLEGVVQKLDHIRSLGANTLYLTPIFKAASNHKYDTADYNNVDPAFGSNADFTRLTVEAKKRGIRVMVDTSFNHTGADSPYFDRFGNFGGQGAFHKGRINPQSPYASWYSFDASQTEPDKQFKGWVGVADLPELNKNDPGFRRFAYGPGGVTQTWLKRGASGWRMDVAPWVPDSFWREWRQAVKRTDREALTVSETWFDASKHVLGDMFDSTMNYIFRNTVLEFANGGNAAELYRNLEHLREAYPPPALHAMMNLLSGHDQARALHHFGWHSASDAPEKVALAKKRLLLATAFQFTYPGSPAIYYGDEVGVTGGDDPYNRATYPWAELGGSPDLALETEFKKLSQLRSKHRVLRQGQLHAPLYQDATTLVLLRTLRNPKPGEAKTAIVALHNAGKPRRLELRLPPAQGGQPLVVELPALSWRVVFQD